MASKQATLQWQNYQESTYYNHEPKSRFKKFMEASFFFNKHEYEVTPYMNYNWSETHIFTASTSLHHYPNGKFLPSHLGKC